VENYLSWTLFPFPKQIHNVYDIGYRESKGKPIPRKETHRLKEQ